MHNSYSEVMLTKELFTKKFNPDTLYNAVMKTVTGDYLEVFDIKQLDMLKPEQIMEIMGTFKSTVIRAYNNKTKHQILQRIIDYCRDADVKFESKVKIGMKDLDWFICAAKFGVCNVYTLLKDRFELAPSAKKKLLKEYGYNTVKIFSKCITEKEFGRYVSHNIDFVRLMKKPTAEMLWEYYNKRGGYDMDREVMVDTYPNDLIVRMIDNRNVVANILRWNDKTGLLSLYSELCSSYMRDTVDADKIRNSSQLDDELKNYAELVNYDKKLVLTAILDRLGVKKEA